MPITHARAPLTRVIGDTVRTLLALRSPCPQCGERPAGRDGPCAACLERRWRARRLGDVITLGPYAGPLGALVRAAKFGGAERAVDHLALPLADALALAVADDATLTGALLVPVPSHPARVRRRGSDLPLRMATAIARAQPQHRLAPAVCRPRTAPAQSTLPLRGRQTYVRDAFLVQPSWCRRVRGRRVVVVDDVLTSGATARAVGDALRAAGAEPRLVVAIAGPGASAQTLTPTRTTAR